MHMAGAYLAVALGWKIGDAESEPVLVDGPGGWLGQILVSDIWPPVGAAVCGPFAAAR